VGTRRSSIAFLKARDRLNLPVRAPTKYRLVINLKTARALDLSDPAVPELMR
jgi:hypothetical protein